MAIGDHVRKQRVRAGRSQVWLAEKLGLSQNTISSWETGRTEPSRADTRRVADALSIDISLLELGDEVAAENRKPGAGRFNSLYAHGFVRVAACSPVVAPADPA